MGSRPGDSLHLRWNRVRTRHVVGASPSKLWFHSSAACSSDRPCPAATTAYHYYPFKRSSIPREWSEGAIPPNMRIYISCRRVFGIGRGRVFRKRNRQVVGNALSVGEDERFLRATGAGHPGLGINNSLLPLWLTTEPRYNIPVAWPHAVRAKPKGMGNA
jgi:hypothetical protein